MLHSSEILSKLCKCSGFALIARDSSDLIGWKPKGGQEAGLVNFHLGWAGWTDWRPWSILITFLREGAPGSSTDYCGSMEEEQSIRMINSYFEPAMIAPAATDKTIVLLFQWITSIFVTDDVLSTKEPSIIPPWMVMHEAELYVLNILYLISYPCPGRS